jgi:glyoxylase-like metal-dependent hydrolase (beta-lactamase superfamily II)
MLSLKRFVCGPLENNVYLIVTEDQAACALVDPGIAIEAVHDYIEQQGLRVELLLLTHGHFDHAFSLGDCAERYPEAKVMAHEGDEPMLERIVETSSMWGIPGASACPEIGAWLEHGAPVMLAGEPIDVLHTPGHSPGQVAFVFDGNAVVGDTLFRRGIGRYDLPGADFAALRDSILNSLYLLPDDTVVWPGHGPETTIGEEKRENPFVPA